MANWVVSLPDCEQQRVHPPHGRGHGEEHRHSCLAQEGIYRPLSPLLQTVPKVFRIQNISFNFKTVFRVSVLIRIQHCRLMQIWILDLQ